MSLTDSLLTMILLTVLVLVVGIVAARRRDDVPGRVQNFVEWVIETLSGFGESMGGSQATRYVPLFAAFFVLILVFNWSGLVPPIGHVDGLRAPTSDLNVTIGLALVAFFTFHIEGFRRLGGRGYLSKFFPFYEFRNGIGAGLIALFVGLVELLLEFIKPVTLSMRLFGNIFGGEVALAVVLGLSAGLLARRALRPGDHAHLRPGAHLQHADAHVHPRGHRESPGRGGSRGRGGDGRRRMTQTLGR